MPRVHNDPINELTSLYSYFSALLQIMNFVVTLSKYLWILLDYRAKVKPHLVTTLLYVLNEVSIF